MAPKSDIEIVNVEWLKSLLNCSTASLDRYIEAGKLPAPFKLGKARLWIKADLIAHLAARAKAARDV